MIVAVDGPTASGKGTLAKAIAAHFGLAHLDTGLLYRAVGRQVQLAGTDPDNPDDALAAADFPDCLLDDPELRSEAIGGFASRVSIHPEVRAALLERQRVFAQQAGGAVLDGRDIDARTDRRFAEMQSQGREMTRAEVRDQIELRDERDMNRKDAPLKPASDAFVLETTALDKNASIAAAIEAVEGERGGPR